MAVYKSVLKNFGANMFGMGVNFLNQIAMVPLFITFWGITRYADWILITALSSFFGMTDMGLNRASNNEFVIKYYEKDYLSCSKLQTNAFLFVLSVFAVFVAISTFISFFFGFKDLLSVSTFTERETSVSFILLITEVFAIMYGRVYHGIYRATSNTHIVIIVDNFIRMGELIILFFGIYLEMDIITMLIIYLIPSLAGIVYKHFNAQKMFKSGLVLKNFDSSVLKSMVKPSLAFMFFPLGQAFSSQGIVFVVNMLLGGTVLVAFTTTRTLVNFLRQLVNMVSTSINPEICAAYGRKDFKTILNLYDRSLVFTFIITVICIVLLLFTGEYIYTLWTKNAIHFNFIFFTGMLIVLLITCLSGLSSVIPLSTNTHVRFTTAFIISQMVGVCLCFVFLTIYADIRIIPIALLISEFSLLLFTFNENNKFFKMNYNEMFSGLWYQTKFLFQKGKQLSQISGIKKK